MQNQPNQTNHPIQNLKSVKVIIYGLFLYANLLSAAEVSLKVNLSPMGNFYGKTSAVQGEARKEGNKYVAENIVVDLKSLKTGIKLRDEHTQKHLETEKFPTAVLLRGEGSDGKGTGKIKIRGIEKDISGNYTIEGKQLKAEFKLKMSDFGIKGVKHMGIGAKDEVQLEVQVPIK